MTYPAISSVMYVIYCVLGGYVMYVMLHNAMCVIM
jgi:hypothetical protein